MERQYIYNNEISCILDELMQREDEYKKMIDYLKNNRDENKLISIKTGLKVIVNYFDEELKRKLPNEVRMRFKHIRKVYFNLAKKI